MVLAVGNPSTLINGHQRHSERDGRGGAIGLIMKTSSKPMRRSIPANRRCPDRFEGRLDINTAILSRSGGNQGIGFAVPVNLARCHVQSLVKEGHVTRGYPGVMIRM